MKVSNFAGRTRRFGRDFTRTATVVCPRGRDGGIPLAQLGAGLLYKGDKSRCQFTNPGTLMEAQGLARDEILTYAESDRTGGNELGGGGLRDSAGGDQRHMGQCCLERTNVLWASGAGAWEPRAPVPIYPASSMAIGMT